MTLEILEKIKIKNKLWTKVAKSKDVAKITEYKKIRNEVTALIFKAKQAHYQGIFEACENDSRKYGITLTN